MDIKEKSKIIITMWIAWGVATIAIAVRDAGDGAAFGIAAAVALGITTVRTFRDPSK